MEIVDNGKEVGRFVLALSTLLQYFVRSIIVVLFLSDVVYSSRVVDHDVLIVCWSLVCCCFGRGGE